LFLDNGIIKNNDHTKHEQLLNLNLLIIFFFLFSYFGKTKPFLLMKATSVIYLSLLLFISFPYAQTTINDPEIKRWSREVKAENLEATVRKLVSFGTRYTKRHQSDTRGIGAAQRMGKV
jgi:hypothetical protein